MNYVREHRKAAGLRREDLAADSGLSIRTIAKIESGRDTRLSTLTAIAEVFRLKAEDLLRPPKKNGRKRAAS